MPQAPLKVLHLTGNLDRGGIETWLMNVFRLADRREVQMDIAVVSPEPRRGQYDAEIQALGGRIHYLPPTGQLPRFGLAFAQMLRRHGPYDVVHSHVHHFGGLALLLARVMGVPVRLATSHSDTRGRDLEARNGRYAYLTAMRAALQASATHRSAVSPEAASALFGPAWSAQGTHLIRLGIDLEALRAPQATERLRTELKLPPGLPVLGHVGQLRPEKNHLFLLDLFQEYLRGFGEARLLLIGEGARRPQIEARIAELGLTGRVQLLGSRADVAELLWLMDVFVFPSLYEGLALALLEARATGLPCVVSTGVPLGDRRDSPGVWQLPLSAGPEAWAAAAYCAAQAGRQGVPAQDLDVRVTTRQLMDFYRQARQGRG